MTLNYPINAQLFVPAWARWSWVLGPVPWARWLSLKSEHISTGAGLACGCQSNWAW